MKGTAAGSSLPVAEPSKSYDGGRTGGIFSEFDVRFGEETRPSGSGQRFVGTGKSTSGAVERTIPRQELEEGARGSSS